MSLLNRRSLLTGSAALVAATILGKNAGEAADLTNPCPPLDALDLATPMGNLKFRYDPLTNGWYAGDRFVPSSEHVGPVAVPALTLDDLDKMFENIGHYTMQPYVYMSHEMRDKIMRLLEGQ